MFLFSNADTSTLPIGVGKSSSVEATAAAGGRPLLQTTPAEIGTTVVEVERNLSRNFRLAEIWRCVLLIDEAEYVRTSQTTASPLIIYSVYSWPAGQGLIFCGILWSQVC